MHLAPTPAEASPVHVLLEREILVRIGRAPTPAEAYAASLMGRNTERLLDLAENVQRGSVALTTYREADRLRREAYEATEAAGIGLVDLDPEGESLTAQIWHLVADRILSLQASILVNSEPDGRA